MDTKSVLRISCSNPKLHENPLKSNFSFRQKWDRKIVGLPKIDSVNLQALNKFQIQILYWLCKQIISEINVFNSRLFGNGLSAIFSAFDATFIALELFIAAYGGGISSVACSSLSWLNIYLFTCLQSFLENAHKIQRYP